MTCFIATIMCTFLFVTIYWQYLLPDHRRFFSQHTGWIVSVCADVAVKGCGNAQTSWCFITAATSAAAVAITAIIATNLALSPSFSCLFGPCGATDRPRHAYHVSRYTCCYHTLRPETVYALIVSPLMGMLHCPIGFDLTVHRFTVKIVKSFTTVRARH